MFEIQGTRAEEVYTTVLLNTHRKAIIFNKTSDCGDYIHSPSDLHPSHRMGGRPILPVFSCALTQLPVLCISSHPFLIPQWQGSFFLIFM